MIDFEWIVAKIQADDYFFSAHANEERMNDDLSLLEIEESIINGMI